MRLRNLDLTSVALDVIMCSVALLTAGFCVAIAVRLVRWAFGL